MRIFSQDGESDVRYENCNLYVEESRIPHTKWAVLLAKDGNIVTQLAVYNTVTQAKHVLEFIQDSFKEHIGWVDLNEFDSLYDILYDEDGGLVNEDHKSR